MRTIDLGKDDGGREADVRHVCQDILVVVMGAGQLKICATWSMMVADFDVQKIVKMMERWTSSLGITL